MKKAIIVGATSGIGREVAIQLAHEGWQIGIAGRREELLQSLQSEFSAEQVKYAVLDVTDANAPTQLQVLIEELGGMDLYFHCSGVGSQNMVLDPDIEIRTAHTNGEGFGKIIYLGINGIAVTNENYIYRQLGSCEQCASYNSLRSFVAAHCVNCYGSSHFLFSSVQPQLLRQ